MKRGQVKRLCFNWFLWQQDSLSCYSFYTWTLFNTNITFKRIEFTKLYRNHCLKRKRIACLFYLISMATGLSFMLLFIYSLQHLCIHNLLKLNQATPPVLRIRPCSNKLTWHHLQPYEYLELMFSRQPIKELDILNFLIKRISVHKTMYPLFIKLLYSYCHNLNNPMKITFSKNSQKLYRFKSKMFMYLSKNKW